MITFQGVSKIYNHHSVALDGVSFKINPHEFVSIVGRSGAGKSTIIKLLIGEEYPNKGRIIFQSFEVSKLRGSDLMKLRRHIGIIFQEKLIQANLVFGQGGARAQFHKSLHRQLPPIGGDSLAGFAHGEFFKGH